MYLCLSRHQKKFRGVYLFIGKETMLPFSLAEVCFRFSVPSAKF